MFLFIIVFVNIYNTHGGATYTRKHESPYVIIIIMLTPKVIYALKILYKSIAMQPCAYNSWTLYKCNAHSCSIAALYYVNTSHRI